MTWMILTQLALYRPNVVNRKNVVVASLAAGTYRQFQRLRAARRSFVGSSCGVCGSRVSKTSFSKRLPLKANRVSRNSSRSWRPLRLINRIFLKQVVFMRPWRFGPMALFSSRLKISGVTMRHKIVGRGLRSGTYPFDGHILFVSSRAGFEIVQKALMARFSAVVSVGAASSLAHDLARRSGLALYSFVRDGRYNHHNS